MQNIKIGLRNLVAIKHANIFQKVIKILKYSSVPRMLQFGLSSNLYPSLDRCVKIKMQNCIKRNTLHLKKNPDHLQLRRTSQKEELFAAGEGEQNFARSLNQLLSRLHTYCAV
jgi:hypothetical protein